MTLATTGAGTSAGPSSVLVVPTTGLLVAGIGELVVTRDTTLHLVAYGLGSCVALSAWDPVTKAAALGHFMLPAGAAGLTPTTPVKFVDGGLDHFLDAFKSIGGRLPRAQLKAAGGASMLSIMAGGLDIARRNGDAILAGLGAAGLRLQAKDLGGSAGRTVLLAAADGRLLVKSVSSTSVL
jgi:chemotaxis protein CheD